MEDTDVAIIGAGPAGSIAAALLRQYGHQVVVLEQSHFPRFSIGESLLPQCMEFIAEAGMLNAVTAEGFQFKNGAVFSHMGKQSSYDFRLKSSPGIDTTFQVQRARFDDILAEEAQKSGVDIRFGHRIESFKLQEGKPVLSLTDNEGKPAKVRARYVLDASGFGRVLPRLLNLEQPSDFIPRMSLFTHIEDNISDADYDRNKIIINIHPDNSEIWYWLIPFSNGRCSLGVVAPQGSINVTDTSAKDALKKIISSSPELSPLLARSFFDTPVNQLNGYACNVKSLWGDGFALLGNAGEFLDPVFSSGVTIAMKSASLIAPLVDRHLNGENIDWESEYAQPLRAGVNTFRTYVNAWYDGSFQKVLFFEKQTPQIKSMIISILAGYVWDQDNPFVKESKRRLNTLVELCS